MLITSHLTFPKLSNNFFKLLQLTLSGLSLYPKAYKFKVKAEILSLQQWEALRKESDGFRKTVVKLPYKSVESEIKAHVFFSEGY